MYRASAFTWAMKLRTSRRDAWLSLLVRSYLHRRDGVATNEIDAAVQSSLDVEMFSHVSMQSAGILAFYRRLTEVCSRRAGLHALILADGTWHFFTLPLSSDLSEPAKGALPVVGQFLPPF